jgi:hypothetical protein
MAKRFPMQRASLARRAEFEPSERPAGELVPGADRQQVIRLRQFFRITTAAQCRLAVKALAWLKSRMHAVRDDQALADRIARQKAALDASYALRRRALAVYETAERTIRDEIARFKTTQHRRRLQWQRRATEAVQQARRPPGAFAPDHDDELPAAVTLAPLSKDGAGWRTWWRVTQVDPKRPLDADGAPIEDVEASIKALAAAVVKGTAPWEFLQVNVEAAERHADTMREEFQVPGLVAWSELRPIVRTEDAS